MKGGLLLDVVVAEGAAVLELLAGEDQALLVGRDALLVLDLGLHIVDRVGRLHLEGDGLAREGLDEDLHDCLRKKKDIRKTVCGISYYSSLGDAGVDGGGLHT